MNIHLEQHVLKLVLSVNLEQQITNIPNIYS